MIQILYICYVFVMLGILMTVFVRSALPVFNDLSDTKCTSTLMWSQDKSFTHLQDSALVAVQHRQLGWSCGHIKERFYIVLYS